MEFLTRIKNVLLYYNKRSEVIRSDACGLSFVTVNLIVHEGVDRFFIINDQLQEVLHLTVSVIIFSYINFGTTVGHFSFDVFH